MQKQKINFIIFGQGRSGSNLLRSLLNSHPKIHCEGELFNPGKVSKRRALSKFFIKTFPFIYILKIKNDSKTEVFGFKFFPWHLKKGVTIPQKLYNEGWKVIHIERKNKLKQALSGLIGRQTGMYVRDKTTASPTETYYIDCRDVVTVIEKRKKKLNNELKAIKGIEHIKVVYEDDLKDRINWNITLAKIFNFLNIETVNVTAETEITDSRSDSERIKNFNEIINYLNANGYAEEVKNYYKYL